jgi:GNAT superfamily N-acetyltransferase
MTQDITPEVIDGLRLYARLTSRPFDEDRWLYWFRDNPYGSGLHILAMYDEKVVGFCSLIPTEMFLAGTALVGAKAEFLAVDPFYRRRSIGESVMPLAFDLVRILYGEAHNYGMEAIVAVAGGPAALCHEFAGARRFEFPCRHFFTFIRPPRLGDGQSLRRRMRRVLLEKGLLIETCVSRLWFDFTRAAKSNGKYTFTTVENLDTDSFYKPNGANRLVYPSSEMLNFRFPDREYAKYLVRGINGPNYLVFAKPSRYGQVVLKDWSTLDLAKSELGNIISQLHRQCSIRKADSMHLFLPNQNQLNSHFLYSLGFLSRSQSSVVYIYSSSNIIKNLCPRSWEFTNAHVGYV